MADLNRSARNTLTYLEKKLGRHLCELLAGYGEGRTAKDYSFSVAFKDAQDFEHKRYLALIPDHSSAIPHGEDQLVLAALLRFLFAKGEPSSVIFRLPDLLKLIGLEHSIVTNKLFETALTRYFNSSYAEVKLEGKRKIKKVPIRRRRLIISYDSEQVGRTNGKIVQTYITVEFNHDFIKGIKERSLFDINWNRVQSLISLPSST